MSIRQALLRVSFNSFFDEVFFVIFFVFICFSPYLFRTLIKLFFIYLPLSYYLTQNLTGSLGMGMLLLLGFTDDGVSFVE